MDVPTDEQVLEAIEAFLERHGMPATKFGMEATRDPNIVGDLRNGKRSPRLRLLQSIKAYMTRKDAELVTTDHNASDTTAAQQSPHGKSGEISTQAAA